METIEKKEQISSKVSADVRRKIEESARKLGLTVSEYVRMKLENNLDEAIAGAPSKSKEPKENSSNSTSEPQGDSTVFLRILATKMGTTNELLEKLLESSTSKSSQENDAVQELGAALLEQEEKLTAAHNEAISKLEEKIKSENLVLKLDENQRNVLSKLILFRKEKGKSDSDNVETFFGWLLKEKFCGAWTGTPQGFDDEFKAAFPSLFAEL
jgi:hypothetical protein